ncbi:hypothetical protein MRX96_037820 [Rhipicephalus microplus]
MLFERTLYGNNGADEAAMKQAEFGVAFCRIFSWGARLSVRTRQRHRSLRRRTVERREHASSSHRCDTAQRCS